MLVYSCLFSLFGYSPHRLDMQLMCFSLSLQQVKTRSWMEKEISSQWAGGGFPRNVCLCLLYISVFLRRELSIRITLLWSYMFHSMGYFLHILWRGGNYQKYGKMKGDFRWGKRGESGIGTGWGYEDKKSIKAWCRTQVWGCKEIEWGQRACGPVEDPG